MATKIYAIERLVRQTLEEPTPRFWSSDELTSIIVRGIKDMWRDIVELKQEHYLTVNETDVSMAVSSNTLTGIPSDVHKVYLIEPLSGGTNDDNYALEFDPRDFNDREFRVARNLDPVDPYDTIIYYAVTAAGAPVEAPVIYVAPQVTSAVSLRFVYVPTISASLTQASNVPIPGDCDNALVAWTVAYARAKERDDRAPDPYWLSVYKGEKDRVVNSLGQRQVQELEVVEPLFKEYS